MIKNTPLRLPTFHFIADPDPAFHLDANPDLDPASQNDAEPCGSGFGSVTLTKNDSQGQCFQIGTRKLSPKRIKIKGFDRSILES
jgi:hypothetical protein